MSAPQTDAGGVAEMVRAFDFPRYAAALFAPADKRRAMLALAAFDLEIQRVPDQVSQPLPGEVRLQWWADAIEGTDHGGVTGHPVAAELLQAMARHELPRAPLLALVGAHTFDLYDDPMPTRAALEVYCDDVCGSLVGLNATLLSDDRAGDDAVRAAGRALGLTRIVARLPHDAARGRCFLPQDMMTAHGVTRQGVVAGEATSGLRTLRGELIDIAHHHLMAARGAIARLPRNMRQAFLPLSTTARELDMLRALPPFALAPAPSRLRVLTSQWWLDR